MQHAKSLAPLSVESDAVQQQVGQTRAVYSENIAALPLAWPR